MRYYFIFFILYEIAISFYFYKQYTNKHYDFHQSTIKLVEHSLESTVNTFELSNDDFHSQHAYELSKLANKANGASKEERDKVRQELLKSFMSFFSNKKLYSLEGMHIFDKNGHSLLRLHRPDKHDDHIVDLRTSLQNMIKDFTYKKGLEIGVYKESYRFQYPLFYDGEFVGSYEYSVSFKTLEKEMRKFFANQYIMLFKAEKIDEVVSAKTIAKRYIKVRIGFEEFYFQASLLKNNSKREQFDYILGLDKTYQYLNSKKTEVLDYSFKGSAFDLVIMPILDISNQHIGYMIVDVDNEYIDNFRYELFINILLATLLSLMGFAYLIRQIKYKMYVRELINMQHDMLIVTDGESIKDANNAMLKFFGYETLKDFERKHLCICDFFIEYDGFLQKNNDGIIWTKYILKDFDKKHRVKMKDISDNKYKIFELEYEVLKKSKYLFIVFKDITAEFEEHSKLVNRANYDSLTNIYNRSSFEHYLERELKRSSRGTALFSLIMFDIDYFKLINDEYGHDVGDVILKELTLLVSSHIRDIDIFARWGGEEFMIISTTNITNSEAFAEKLREIIQEYKFSNVGKVTCSFGVTQYHVFDTKEIIVKRCDNMLYSAKESGRNCVASIR